MKSASNGDILNVSLQVLHIHVPPVTPLCASHMAKPGTNQHQSRVTVWEVAHHAGAAANLPVQPLNDIVGSDTSPVFTGKITVGESLLNVIGGVKDFSQNGLQFLEQMKLAGNRGILKGCLQALHVHVLLVSPLGTCHMPQLSADQHESGVAVRE